MDRSLEKDELMNAAPSRRVEIDVDRYTAYLEDAGMSEEDKRVFVETLWSILVQFVDLGFDLHPMMKDDPAPAGPVDKRSGDRAKGAADRLHSSHPQYAEEPVR